MKKFLIALMWLIGGVACAQSINGTNPSTLGIDGSNTTAAKVISLPQVQSTVVYNTSATPSPVNPQPTQASNWFQMNGNGALLVEFGSNTFSGTYAVQVSNNPTPVATNVTNIYTIAQDTATYATGGQGAQTKDWTYYIREGWKYVRFIAQPDTVNVGTLNIQGRLFGNPPAGDASRSYVTGVPWKQSDILVPVGTSQSAVTNYYDYKLPNDAIGFNLYSNIQGASGAATLITEVFSKDPISGQLQALGAGLVTIGHAAGFETITVAPGYGSPYPVATPPAGTIIYSQNVPQDLVILDTATGTGAVTFSQSVQPMK